MAKKKRKKTSTLSMSRAERKALREKEARRTRIQLLALGAVSVAVLTMVVFLAVRGQANLPGERVNNLGNQHISAEAAASAVYNSKPPTSGPHFGQIAPWGVHTEPIPDALQIHNLEDGGVGIWYNCPDGCPELVDQLTGIVDEMGEERLLLAPYPDMDATIALTAWNRIDKMEKFDRERIIEFIKAYRGRDHHVGGG